MLNLVKQQCHFVTLFGNASSCPPFAIHFQIYIWSKCNGILKLVTVAEQIIIQLMVLSLSITAIFFSPRKINGSLPACYLAYMHLDHTESSFLTEKQ